MENKIICGDIFEVLQKFPDNTVDYTITSPPYNVGWNNMHGEDYTRYDEVKDKMTAEQYGVWQDKVMAELLRVTKKHIFYNIQMLSNNKLAVIALLANYRHKFKDVLVWKKNNFPPAIEPGVMSTAFEFIFVFSNEAPDKRKFYDANFHANFLCIFQAHL
jgi:DNA modification methylase